MPLIGEKKIKGADNQNTRLNKHDEHVYPVYWQEEASTGGKCNRIGKHKIEL